MVVEIVAWLVDISHRKTIVLRPRWELYDVTWIMAYQPFIALAYRWQSETIVVCRWLNPITPYISARFECVYHFDEPPCCLAFRAKHPCRPRYPSGWTNHHGCNARAFPTAISKYQTALLCSNAELKWVIDTDYGDQDCADSSTCRDLSRGACRALERYWLLGDFRDPSEFLLTPPITNY